MSSKIRSVIAVMVLAAVSVSVQAAPTVLFYDNISGYTAGPYATVNTEVVHTQNNGNGWVNDNKSSTGVDPYAFNTTLPNQAMTLYSGAYAAYNTYAVNANGTARYGQVMCRIGHAYGQIIHVGLFGGQNGAFDGGLWGAASNSAAEVEYHFTNNLYYKDATQTFQLASATNPNAYQNLTINYDLQAQTYDVWLDSTNVASGIGFGRNISSIQSIAIGSEYFTSGSTNALDSWQWEASDTDAFTSYGVSIVVPNEVPTVIFYDNISGYTGGGPYATLNTDVTQTQANGSGWVGDNKSSTGVDPYAFNTTLPNQAMTLYGGYMQYNTYAVNRPSTIARYGQVMCRIGHAYGTLVRVGIFGVANATFPNEWADGSANVGPEVRYHFTNYLACNNAGTFGNQLTIATNPNAYQNLTINYDLMAHSYDVWLDTTKVASGLAFGNNITSVESIAIGAAYFDAGPTNALDSWQWQISYSQPFTSYGFTATFAEPPSEVVFVDDISGYFNNGTRYDAQNPEVVLSQNNGAAQGGPVPTGTSFGPYSVNAPKSLVSLDSSYYEVYTTLAVPNSRSERYGQIMAKIASTGNKRVRLAACGTANPVFPGTPDFPGSAYDYEYSGPDIFWNMGYTFAYFTQDATSSPYAYAINGVGSYSDQGFHSITINYDLQLGKYSVFEDTNSIVNNVNFAYPQTSIESIALGASWEAPNQTAVLDYWHWKVSDSGPFTFYGKQVTAQCGDPGTLYKAGDINKDCYVDFKDIQILASYWLQSCTSGQPCAVANLNSDNKINVADFAMIALDWMKCTDPAAPDKCK